MPPPGEMADLALRLQHAIDSARRIGLVARDSEAEELWAKVYPALSSERPGLLGAMTARAAAQVLRISLIYAVLDSSSLIRPAHLHAALAVWQYCVDSAAYVFGARLGNPLADELLDHLHNAADGLTRTEIQAALSRNYAAEAIHRALAVLIEHDLVDYESVETGQRADCVTRSVSVAIEANLVLSLLLARSVTGMAPALCASVIPSRSGFVLLVQVLPMSWSVRM